MAIKIIKYIPKITHARTQYVDIDQEDMLWLQTELIRWLSLMGALDGHRNEDIKLLMKYWWYKRTGTLPKGIHGQNSPLQFVSGIINNLLFGTQRNLSVIQMEALENLSAKMAQFDDAISELDISNNNGGISFKFQLGLMPISIKN